MRQTADNAGRQKTDGPARAGQPFFLPIKGPI
jgi:hypothetical protein